MPPSPPRRAEGPGPAAAPRRRRRGRRLWPGALCLAAWLGPTARAALAGAAAVAPAAGASAARLLGRGARAGRGAALARCAAGPAANAAAARLLAALASRDAGEIEAARVALPPNAGGLAALVGDWKADYSDMAARSGRGGGPPPGDPPPTVSLKFLSFMALPDVQVQIVGGWNRVTGSASEGGVYELYQEFTVPGSPAATAAMVLAGPWGPSEGGEPGRAAVHFQTVTLVPSRADAAASAEMLEAAGLSAASPAAVKAPPTYIDVLYADDALRVHRAQSGTNYVLTRGDVPFDSP